MAFEKDGYVLHTREVQLKGGRNQKIYYFCKAGNKPKSGKPCDMPDGYTTGVNKRTKLPYPRKPLRGNLNHFIIQNSRNLISV